MKLIFCLFIIIFSVSGWAADPNLNSYKDAGECSDLSSDERCVYCPIKKKFIALPENSLDQTPKDSDYEFIDHGKQQPAEKGTR